MPRTRPCSSLARHLRTQGNTAPDAGPTDGAAPDTPASVDEAACGPHTPDVAPPHGVPQEGVHLRWDWTGAVRPVVLAVENA